MVKSYQHRISSGFTKFLSNVGQCAKGGQFVHIEIINFDCTGSFVVSRDQEYVFKIRWSPRQQSSDQYRNQIARRSGNELISSNRMSVLRRFRGDKFLKARIIPKRIEHGIEPE